MSQAETETEADGWGPSYLGGLEREAAEARRERDEARREAQGLSERIEALERSGPPSREPTPAWQEKLERGRDLGDDGLIRKAYEERDEAELAEQLQRQAAEQAEQAREVAERHGWSTYEAETARLAASDDPGEREAAKLRLAYNTFAAQAEAQETQAEVDRQVFAQMDAEGRQHGWFAPGQHVDHDSYVAAYKRELDTLARRGPDDIDAVKRTREVEAALEQRIAELHENPGRSALAPGSQEVPPGVSHPQAMEGRLADAEREAITTGDWSKWDRLQVEATTRGGGV